MRFLSKAKFIKIIPASFMLFWFFWILSVFSAKSPGLMLFSPSSIIVTMILLLLIFRDIPRNEYVNFFESVKDCLIKRQMTLTETFSNYLRGGYIENVYASHHNSITMCIVIFLWFCIHSKIESTWCFPYTPPSCLLIRKVSSK